ncbi:hypothetical protein B7486_24955 [cyanobacterium TDX16]|nr:hypothetical protein B7486_24955 [cyanobacterium TDX16]
MNKSLWRSLLASPVVFATILACSPLFPAAANPIAQPSQEKSTLLTEVPKGVNESGQVSSQNTSNSLAQVTSVSQLSDVQPTDWAFQALQSLVERYGCIAGYPDGTYRGNRALTRYEFAAGLNACLDRVNELIATATTDLVTKEDLATLQKLQEEFGTELATLRGRVDSLEAATAELEANQFSTTTKLSGAIIAAVSDVFSGDTADGGEVEDNTIFTNRARIEFNTSFTGQDSLYTLMSAGNLRGYAGILGTNEGELSFLRAQDEDQPDNDFALETLEYAFPLGESTEVLLGIYGAAFYDFADTVTVFDGDGDSGSLSLYGTRNPLYNQVFGSGLGIKHEFGDSFEVSLGYLAEDGSANSPGEGSGLFNGPYGAFGQILFKGGDRFKLGLTYVHAYNASDTFTGSAGANPRSFIADELGIDAPTSTDTYGVQLSWQVTDGIVVGGWAGYNNTRLLSSVGGQLDRGTLDIWNYAVTLGFPDLGKEGSLLGFMFGMEPKVTESTIDQIAEDENDSFHIEGFYQYQLTDNIAVTPGVIWITSPGFNNDNDDAIIGALRTTFSF